MTKGVASVRSAGNSIKLGDKQHHCSQQTLQITGEIMDPSFAVNDVHYVAMMD